MCLVYTRHPEILVIHTKNHLYLQTVKAMGKLILTYLELSCGVNTVDIFQFYKIITCTGHVPQYPP